MILEIAAIAAILFLSVVVHECAHGWVAYQLGDPTAKLAGRLTLNPLKHIDPVGTIFLPGVLIAMRLMNMGTPVFGWAKPVPVNFARLHHPKRDMIWVGLAGPAVNIVFAILFSLFSKFEMSLFWQGIIAFAVFINLLLAIFNLIPIPPLDGSRLVMGVLPRPWAIRYGRLEPYGIFIVIMLIYLKLFDLVLLPLVDMGLRLLGSF
jgi:Zn-dependent protease